MQNNFSFRRDLCVNGNSETIELDGTTEDVLRVLYALEQPAFASPCLRTMLQENLDRTQTEYEVEMDVSQLTDEEKANVERIVNKAFNTPEAKEKREEVNEKTLLEVKLLESDVKYFCVLKDAVDFENFKRGYKEKKSDMGITIFTEMKVPYMKFDVPCNAIESWKVVQLEKENQNNGESNTEE